MRCEKFEKMWNDCLDERKSPQSNEELSAHAALCPKCAELMAGGELLNWAFPGLPQPALSTNFSDRVISSLGTLPSNHAPIPVAYEVFSQSAVDSQTAKRGAASSRISRSKIVAWSSGLVAAVAVMLTIGLATRDGSDPAKATTTPTVTTVVKIAPPVATPKATIAKVAPTTTTQATSVTQASDYFPTSSTVAVGTVFRRDHMSQVGFAVADGITPVSNSVSYALQSLKRTPVVKSHK